MTIGERIYLKRKEKRITLEQLARMVGTSKQTIQRYEKGVISNIPSDKIESISIALSVSPAYIMGWEDTEPLTKESVCDNLVSDFLDLSEENQKKAIEYIKLLKKAAE